MTTMWSWLLGYKHETCMSSDWLHFLAFHTHTHTHTHTLSLSLWRTTHEYSTSSTSPYCSVPMFTNYCSCFRRVQFIRMWGTLKNPHCLIPRMKFKPIGNRNCAAFTQSRLRAGRPGNDISILGRYEIYRVAHEKPTRRLVDQRGRRSRTLYRKLNKCKCKVLTG